MSDHLDGRIKELYAELTEAAPELPPLPAPGRVSRRWASRPVTLAAAGVAAFVLVVGTGVALLSQTDLGGSDDAAAPPPAATSAPQDSGDSADTVIGAPEAPGQPGTQRPTDTILLLAELNQACATANAALASELPAAPSTRGEFIAAFDLVANQIGPIRAIAQADQSADPTLAAISAQSLAVLQILEEGPDEDQAVSSGRLTAALLETRTLSLLLEGFGALDCAGLGVLP